MATLLGLPLLSALALPFMSSSTTSLNVAFFYMTWLTLTLSHPPLNVELYLLSAVRFAFYLLPSALSLLFDTLIPSLAVRTKALDNGALPGRLGGKRIARIVALSTANVLGGVFLFVGVEWLLTEGLGTVFHVNFRSGLMVSKKLPAPWTVIIDVLKLTGTKGLLQYYIHRHVLHAQRNTPFTNLHATYFHSLRFPFSFAAHYDHSLPYLIHYWVPTYLPALILRPHILSFALHLALVSLSETVVHSGYNAALLPSAIILPGMARRLEGHMTSRGQGNFGAVGVLDWVHDTGVQGVPDVGDDAQDEFDKHHGREKVQKTIDSAGRLGGRLKRGGKQRSS